jgi:hypothetical protein
VTAWLKLRNPRKREFEKLLFSSFRQFNALQIKPICFIFSTYVFSFCFPPIYIYIFFFLLFFNFLFFYFLFYINKFRKKTREKVSIRCFSMKNYTIIIFFFLSFLPTTFIFKFPINVSQ